MTKSLLLFIILLLLINSGKCKTKMIDTLIVFYSVEGYSVRNIDSADSFMLIMPPDSNDNRNNVKGFYKDGKVKFVGKDAPNNNSLKTGSVLFDGEYISYYQDGKRKSIANYKAGYKNGFEYLYYPDGREYSCIKHQWHANIFHDDLLNWGCYDEKGNTICSNGNGRWITYIDANGNWSEDLDRNKTIKLEGEVKNGRMEGEWRGKMFSPDTISFTYNYKKGQILSSTGFDKKGVAYSFKQEWEWATYQNLNGNFTEALKSRFKLPKDKNDQEIAIDSLRISFIVEKNGQTDNFEVLGSANSQLEKAISEAMQKCSKWSGTRVYGIPFRTKVTFPLKEIIKNYDTVSESRILFHMKVIN